VVLAALLLGGAVLAVRSLKSFLSLTSPVTAEILIVEGWLPDDAMRDAIAEFKRGGYKYLVTSGGPLPDEWFSSRYKTGAEFAAANLAALGLATNVITSVPPPDSNKDRTYSAALAVKEWLAKEKIPVHAVNVYSLSVHARRSRLLFQKAFGSEIKVGVFAHPDGSDEAGRWWTSMGGVRKVIGEGIAYVYARCIFPFMAKNS